MMPTLNSLAEAVDDREQVIPVQVKEKHFNMVISYLTHAESEEYIQRHKEDEFWYTKAIIIVVVII